MDSRKEIAAAGVSRADERRSGKTARTDGITDDVLDVGLSSALNWRLPIVSLVFLALIGGITWGVITESQRRLIEHEATEIATVVAHQAKTARSVYADLAVVKLARDGTGGHISSHEQPGYVPLPAQFLSRLSERASAQSDVPYRLRPLSKWNLGAGQGLTDDFQRWAWSELEKQNEPAPASPIDWKPVWRIESVNGVRTLRYMQADPALDPSCLGCHNAREQSEEIRARRLAQGTPPGRRVKLHQLLGALEVSISMDSAVAIARNQTQLGAFAIIGVLLIGLVGVGIIVYVDVSRTQGMARKLAWQASHDGLTDLPNRDAFDRHLQGFLDRPDRPPLALVLLDLNHFKDINDTLGHQIGDQVLVQVGQRLRASIRPQDVVARLGGDEFALLLPGAGRENAAAVAVRLGELLDHDVRVGEYRLVVGASIGIALAPEHGDDAAELLRCADVAMYSAKRDKQDFAYYEEAADDNKPARLAFVKDLREAIRGNELELHYQPKIDLRRDRVSGVEALLRWTHPTHGRVPPDEIVAISERTGLVRELTNWVLGEALDQCRRWQESGMALHVAVNLSVHDLQDSGLAGQVGHELERTGVTPEQLVLEVTEGAMMSDPDGAARTLARLEEMGVHLAIDDFGTGYSSLGYLNRLPVHELKLDRSFVMRMDRGSRDAAIVQATVELAHKLGLRMVAEGVENEDILVELGRMGADIAQGYHICRPVPAAELQAWLKPRLDGTSSVVNDAA